MNLGIPVYQGGLLKAHVVSNGHGNLVLLDFACGNVVKNPKVCQVD